MEISDLKQPYRRMAEYLADTNTSARFKNKEILSESFDWYQTNIIFWVDIADGDYPPITEEIKKHFPPDFDFSGEEEIKNKPVMQMLDLETQKIIYTQLAKEGKFDKLPDTCEFSEPVKLEVSNFNGVFKKVNVVGKFKSKFVEKEDISPVGYIIWNYAQLPTPKIDFSQFKSGDVVEFQYDDDKFRIGYINSKDNIEIEITHTKNQKGEIFKIKEIKSITKIK